MNRVLILLLFSSNAVFARNSETFERLNLVFDENRRRPRWIQCLTADFPPVVRRLIFIPVLHIKRPLFRLWGYRSIEPWFLRFRHLFLLKIGL